MKDGFLSLWNQEPGKGRITKGDLSIFNPQKLILEL